MRVLLDENLAPSLVPALREAGHNAVHAADAGLASTDDDEILKWCCANARALVTADKKLTKYLASSRASCPSVMIVRGVGELRAGEVGHLLIANLPNMAAVIAEHGDAIFVLAPNRPIRAVVLPLGHTELHE